MTILITFLDAEGLVHHKFVPECQTKNQTVYRTILQCLWDAVCQKWPHKWLPGNRLLHHDNAPCHAAMTKFLEMHSIPMAPHPTYSPDLAHCKFFLPLTQAEEHPEGEIILRHRGGTSKHDVAAAGHSETSLPDRKDSWDRCIESGGSYFKGDNLE